MNIHEKKRQQFERRWGKSSEPVPVDDDLTEYCPCAGSATPSQTISKNVTGSATKSTIVTLNIGNVLTAKSRASMQAAASRWGMDFREITAPILSGIRACWQKVFLCKWAKQFGYERVLYLDADILIRDDCPSPVEATAKGTLGVVWDGHYTTGRLDIDHEQWAKRLNKPVPEPKQRLNAGVIVFEPRTHEFMFDLWAAAGKSARWLKGSNNLFDQPALCILAQEIPLTWLPMHFNAQTFRMPMENKTGYMREYVYHFTGGHDKRHIAKVDWQAKSESEPVTSGSKYALITLNIGNCLPKKARESLQHAARRWGADYVEITEPVSPVGGRPHWQKAFLARLGKERGYNRCVFYDADILIRSDCPSIFEQVPKGLLGIVTNDQIDGKLWQPGTKNRFYPALSGWARRLGMKCPPMHEHCNTGMIVFEPKIHADIFEAWIRAGKSCNWGSPTMLVDQAPFAVLLYNMYGDTKKIWLPVQFNTIGYNNELLSVKGRQQTYVYHYTGMRKHRMNETQWLIDGNGRVESAPVTFHAEHHKPSATTLGECNNLRDMFERVVCINLRRRYDRWKKFKAGLPKQWPFAPVVPFEAIDVQRCEPPNWWKPEPGQWGCRQSHLRVIEDALNDGVNSILIFEDDAQFPPDFLDRLRAFIANVPDDWEILYLGGTNTKGTRKRVNDEVDVACYQTLAHAYALRGSALNHAYEFGHRQVEGNQEFDHRLGQLASMHWLGAYVPRKGWMVYQSEGFSDLTLKHMPLRGVYQSELRDGTIRE